MNDINSWMPAIGLSAIIVAVASLMIALTLHEIQGHLDAIRRAHLRHTTQRPYRTGTTPED